MALCAGCEHLRAIRGMVSQQLVCCSIRNMWRCDRVSGGAASEQSEQGGQEGRAIVLMPGPYDSNGKNVNAVRRYSVHTLLCPLLIQVIPRPGDVV